MKKLFTLFVIIALTNSVFAQSPHKMSYQAVIRNSSGQLVASHTVGMKISGGMPAARMGDMAACAGPPDGIIIGSSTVLIGGQPAARMGDQTSHGGIIVEGFPQVLIGP
jgi:uncharacterized Zn-binding protein involved in type VI secretion